MRAILVTLPLFALLQLSALTPAIAEEESNPFSKNRGFLQWANDSLGSGSPSERLMACTQLLHLVGRDNSATIPLDTPPSSPDANLDQKVFEDIRKLILTTPHSLFNAAWGPIDRKLFYEIIHKVQRGEIQASDLQKNRLLALEKLLSSEANKSFWSNETNPWTSLMTQNPEFRGPGHLNNLGGVIGGTDTYAMMELEKDIMKAALNKEGHRVSRGKWYQRLNHPLFVVPQIFEYFDQLRLDFEYIDAAFSLIRNFEAESLQLKLLKAESDQLSEYKNRLFKLRKDVRSQAVEVLGGQDVFTGAWSKYRELDIYKIAARIKASGSIQRNRQTKLIQEIEKIAEEWVFTRDQIRARNGLGPKPIQDYFAETLRIMHQALKVDSAKSMEKWWGIMQSKVPNTSLAIDYSYTYTWTETETDKDGKTTTVNKSETRYGTNRVQPNYYEVLVDRLSDYAVGKSFSSTDDSNSTITGVTGKEKVLKESLLAYNLERPLLHIYKARDLYINAVQAHAGILLENNSDRIRREVQGLETKIGKLERVLSEIQKALRPDGKNEVQINEVLSRWSVDTKEHFLARMGALATAQAELNELLDIYREQLSDKEHELIIEAAKVDHSKELSALRMKAGLYYTSLTGLMAGSGYSAYLFVEKDPLQLGPNFYSQAFQSIMSLF